jgi:hypothetical protein
VLVARAGRLGLDREAVRASLPRLRGALRRTPGARRAARARPRRR